MKSTIIPAQITTVEDKIAGNLNITQLLLLSFPFFAGSAVYVLLPPFFAPSAYKIILISLGLVLFPSLAIRFRERIIARWSLILIRFYFKPRYYLPGCARDKSKDLESFGLPEVSDWSAKVQSGDHSSKTLRSLPVMLQAGGIIDDKLSNVGFKINKKGSLNVYIIDRE